MAEVVHMIDSEVFLAFSTYATIIILKTMLMSLMTSFRLSRKIFVNEENVFLKSEDELKKTCRKDPDVEQVRSGSEDDPVNIVLFVLIGLLYALTGPDLHIALLHFRLFLCSRLVYSLANITPLPQPSRALGFLVGVVCTLSMAYRVLYTTFYL